MPAYKTLIVANNLKAAGKLRKCFHSKKHSIRKGESVLEVREGMAWKGYCAECAGEMIAAARTALDTLASALRR